MNPISPDATAAPTQSSPATVEHRMSLRLNLRILGVGFLGFSVGGTVVALELKGHGDFAFPLALLYVGILFRYLAR
ncbi:MAG: hypothetical protein Q7N87_03160 [Candidatus Uhrbacteria bacterium]|nr:hypothetical protein [Candidatus Uhrbacteria bacterium]